MTNAVTRRTVLGTFGSLAGMAAGLGSSQAAPGETRVRLRLLETSDLHMFVLDWDYYQSRIDPAVGLAKVASLIATARAESPNTLLFDNGDFLQGTPLADYVAQQSQPTPTAPHPLMTIMNGLRYDAATLGNHEFNFGVPFLEATLAGASFPLVCANVTRTDGAPFLPATVVLDRYVKDEAGNQHPIRIGVIGFVPPQIMGWDKAHLTGHLQAADIVLTAKQAIPALRARCDVLVVLCHSGIQGGAWVEGAEHCALHLAAIPGIDVIMTGHSHKVFPGPDYANIDGVDAATGRLHGVPAVMPGFWGSHLGIVDLDLKRSDERWTVEAAKVDVRPIAQRKDGKLEALTTRDATIAALIAPAHEATLAWVEQPAGTLAGPVHSYFVWAGYDPATALVHRAQLWYAKPLLAGTEYADLPLLSAAAPFRAGYTPESFIDIPGGQVTLRAVSDLYYFSNNTVTVMKVTGAQIVEWLESAVRIFATVDPATTDPQPLIEKRVPSYTFDTIAGLTYAIDVTKPPRYDNKGTLNPQARRIFDLRFEGKPLALDREFLVVANSYRADGGGNVAALQGAKVVLRAPDTNRDAVLRYVKANSPVAVPAAVPWTFAPIGKTRSVYFDTSKQAPRKLADRPGLVHLGDGEPGYARIGLTLE